MLSLSDYPFRSGRKTAAPRTSVAGTTEHIFALENMEPRRSSLRGMIALLFRKREYIKPKTHVRAAGAVVSNGVLSDNGAASNDEEALRHVPLRHNNAVGHVQLQLHFSHLN
jgi:hypothetical protein